MTRQSWESSSLTTLVIPCQHTIPLAMTPSKKHERVNHHAVLVRASLLANQGLSLTVSFSERRVDGRGGLELLGRARRALEAAGEAGAEEEELPRNAALYGRGGGGSGGGDQREEEGREAGERKGARKECVLGL